MNTTLKVLGFIAVTLVSATLISIIRGANDKDERREKQNGENRG